jgi:hypothetical protein
VDYELEGTENADQVIGNWIREQGKAATEKWARKRLLAVMNPYDVSQLAIVVSPTGALNGFAVRFSGPPVLVAKAKSVLVKKSGAE